MKALSVRQPWASAIMHGGKRIENRAKWKNCHYRGPIYIHAAKTWVGRYVDEALTWMRERNLWPERNTFQYYEYGAIIGRADIVDVIFPGGAASYSPTKMGSHRLAEDPWYMGGFALVLDNVHPVVTTPCKGMLGLFEVPEL